MKPWSEHTPEERARNAANHRRYVARLSPEQKMAHQAKTVAWRRDFRAWMAGLKLAIGCECCGYNRCAAALDAHHRDPSQKDDALSKAHSKKFVLDEMAKCAIVCARCHREIHAGIRQCPPPRS